MRVRLLPICVAVLAIFGLLAAEDGVEPHAGPVLRPGSNKTLYSVPVSTNFRTETALVLVPVTVVDPRNRAVNGLAKEDFQLFEDNQEQTILSVSNEDTPMSVGLLFDCSGSMGDKLQKSRQAAAEFLKIANPNDEFFLVTFREAPTLNQGFTQDQRRIQDLLASTESRGTTALLDAIYLGVHEMKKARNSRKALLIISDGGDNNSRFTISEAKNAIRESDAQIYAIGIYESLSNRYRTPEEGAGPALLSEFAKQTGGRHYQVENLNKLPGIAAAIALELRNQYILSYAPQNRIHDGKYRQIRVKLAQSHGRKAYWRRGYFAPAE